MKRILGISLALLLLSLSSCHYKPFVKYYFNKKGIRKFNKKERLAGNAENPHRAYHIHLYDWDVSIEPDRKRLKGSMDIHFSPEMKQDTFLFDLQRKMKISNYQSEPKGVVIKRKGDLFYAIWNSEQAKGKRIKLSIQYGGKPANIMSEGPIKWQEDEKERHWISTVTEGIGPHFIMPCSALLNKEADSTKISISAPNDLVAASNGQFLGSKTNTSGIKTSDFLVSYPINIYNISFNLGHFVKLEKPYTDINDVDRIIECYVLDYNRAKADTFYNQAPIMMKVFEEAYGTFPWWRDGCRFIESNFSAMEHQSGIAMGGNYRYHWKKKWNVTLAHELSHEWWGNQISGKDYCDIWIHEGMATFSEALFLKTIYDEEAYNLKTRHAILSVYNTIPVYKECGVLYNSWTNGPDQDIYDKGSLMVHSLRKVVNNDSLFFSSLKNILREVGVKNVTTYEMIELFNQQLGADYSALFNWYLHELDPPILHVRIDKEKRELHYKWNKEIPFYPNGKIFIKTNKEANESMTLVPTQSFQTISTKGFEKIEFEIEKSVYYKIEVEK